MRVWKPDQSFPMNEYRPGAFNLLPPVVKNLIIINTLFFLTTLVLKKFGIDLNFYLDLFYPSSPFFHFWQPVTYLFMHGGWSHLIFNMFALWMFGYLIENVMGTKRFLIFYFVCGIGAAVCQISVFGIEHYQEIQIANEWFAQLNGIQQSQTINMLLTQGRYPALMQPLVIPTLGASGAIFGVLFAFGYLFPNMLIYLYFLVPIKAKWFVALYAAMELFFGLGGYESGVAHFAHLGGILFAFILLRIWNMNHKNIFY